MEEELKKLGLTKHEAKVYLVALSLGPSTVLQLANHTEIKRPTVYLATKNLIRQGLMYQTLNKKNLFIAEKPQKLEKLTKRLRRRVIDAEILLESILPELVKLPKQYNEEPKVTFYSGVEGIKDIALEVSASLDSWYFFGPSVKVLEKIIKFKRMDILEDSWVLRNNPERPKIYIITDNGIFSLGKEWTKNKTDWREVKILPNTINASSGFIIFEDKLLIFSFENKPFATVIKSKEVVEVVKLMYKLIWKSLPEK
ncbi:MAG: helix-turn-helix domain-containing protein [Candidatus Paceibacterota bacterium]